jgi:O-antigen ligase
MSPDLSFRHIGQYAPEGRATGLLMLASAALVLLPGLSPLFMALGLVMLLKHAGRRPEQAATVQWNSPLTWMGALFLLYVIGLGWSSNMDYAGFDLQVKATMVLIPLAVLFIPKEGRTGGERLLLAFRTAAALASFICIVSAFGTYGIDWWSHHSGRQANAATTGVLISTNFSLFMHPSYFAMYLCLALASSELGSARAERPWERWLGPLLVTGILLSASKAGWIALVLYGCLTLMINWRNVGFRRRRILQATGAAVALAVLTQVSPFFREKIDQFSNVLKGAPVDVSAQGSTESRELIWGAALPLIREHMPWGTGTGDVKDELIQRYTELGYVHAAEIRLNAHSQLLQTPLTLGLPGLLLLYGLLLVPGLHAIKRKDGLMAYFLLLLMVNWATESMLETQAGVLFLSWGALMLAMRSSPTDHSSSDHPIAP